ncbi:MAG: transcription elongation factor GreA [Candidatus Vogelbacteria bacterium]|nr:transcription elongation factor GreA [Candidatus Vogelbacteria bacterium]
MSPTVEYLTKEKLAELEKELAQAKNVTRKEIAEALEFAKSLGDLSENAEYHQARENQGLLEDRILEIEDILKRAVVVSDKSSGQAVSMGSTVTILKEGDKESRTCKVVGSEEADVVTAQVSNECPLGMAILGRKVGESFTVLAPKGKVNYKVVAIK